MAHEETATFQTRYHISASIILDSSLHIGSGETDTRSLDDTTEKSQVSTIVRDYRNKPYIPGSTLRGLLRDLMEHNQNITKDTIKALFGTGEENNECGGKLRFANAYFNETQSNLSKPDNEHILKEDQEDCQGLLLKKIDIKEYKRRHWDENRWSWIINGVAIDRCTGSAAEHRLFFYEAVPPGTVFTLGIEAIGLGEDDIELLFKTLSFLKKENNLILGRGQAVGFGKCHIGDDICLHGITDKNALHKWLENHSAAGLNSLPKLSAPGINTPLAQKNNTVTLHVTLKFNGPLLVNDPSSTYKNPKKNEAGLGHVYLSDHKNRIFLPGTSFKGAFRSQMERIVRTMGDRINGKVLSPQESSNLACYPSGEKELCCPDINKKDDIAEKLCLVCRICGGRGYRSPLMVSEFSAKEGKEGELRLQDFVAIDRFTGGVAGDKKFNALHREDPELTGSITLDCDRIDEPLLGLFFLTLRDLIEGDIAFGYGKTKGFGYCTAEVTLKEESNNMFPSQSLSEDEAWLAAAVPQVKELEKIIENTLTKEV
ncbi:hypothetical protein DGMP_11730 [Desulfomarina profundi]|uniref:CRISPR type III-associated protein domain-containing protein n=1 Tax=Desulfomarina profundi TaxID=2772557 RepID=A0A8D5FMP8_9BACT|nr:RAMP superfamily CRISPR-associated protein [Desulfomarina profundi]BCL60480.1 hypothetical protein DGMP_11730 [Desulfomarina profundi]